MEKIEKQKNKSKTKTTKSTYFGWNRVFFPETACSPLIFSSNLEPSPHKFGLVWNCILFYPDSCGLCRAASKIGGFVQRIHWFCVDERLNLVKQYLTSEKSDSLGPKLSALQLWDCLGEHVEQPPWIMTRRASCCVPLCTNNFRNSPETFHFAFRHVCLHSRPHK